MSQNESKRNRSETSSCSSVEFNFKKLDTRLSPIPVSKNTDVTNIMAATVAHESQGRQDAIDLMKADAPPWFANVFDFLLKDVNAIKASCSDYQATKIRSIANATEITKLANKVTQLEGKQSITDAKLSKLMEDNAKLESYNRRDNLLIDGIKENPNENVSHVLVSFLKANLNINEEHADSLKFANVHRLGKPPHMTTSPVNRPRTIFVRFSNFSDRSLVWSSKRNLKNSKFSMAEDFPQAIREKRKALLPYFLAARKHPRVKKCFMIYDKLCIDRAEFRIDNIAQLPYDLKYAGACERYIADIDATVFFGMESVYSNFHPGKIKDGLNSFADSETFYQFHKASFFDDDETASTILCSKSPRQAKAISYNIKNFNEQAWYHSGKAREVMHKAVLLKFTQNFDLQNHLINNLGNFIEANPNDKFYSCGYGISHPDVGESSKWEGSNVLGDILSVVRAELQ